MLKEAEADSGFGGTVSRAQMNQQVSIVCYFEVGSHHVATQFKPIGSAGDYPR